MCARPMCVLGWAMRACSAFAVLSRFGGMTYLQGMHTQGWHLMRSPCRRTKGQGLRGFASRKIIELVPYARSTCSTKFCTKYKESSHLSIQGFKQKRCRWRIHPTPACGPKTSWSGKFPRSPKNRSVSKKYLSAGRDCPQPSPKYIYPLMFSCFMRRN